jgi:hypothetical protein
MFIKKSMPPNTTVIAPGIAINPRVLGLDAVALCAGHNMSNPGPMINAGQTKSNKWISRMLVTSSNMPAPISNTAGTDHLIGCFPISALTTVSSDIQHLAVMVSRQI